MAQSFYTQGGTRNTCVSIDSMKINITIKYYHLKIIKIPHVSTLKVLIILSEAGKQQELTL